MSAPVVRKPADVPDLRLWIVEQWKPGRPFERTAEIANQSTVYQSETGEWLSATSPQWDLRVMKEATLWYVTTEMCELVEHAAHQIPDDLVLTLDSVPDPFGFVVFERPMIGTDAVTQETLYVDAVAWGPSPHVSWDERNGVGMQSYRRLSLGNGLNAQEMGLAYQSGALATVIDQMHHKGKTQMILTQDDDMEVWSWLGRTDWMVGDTVNTKIVRDLEEHRHRSMVEDRRWLAALWFLSTQPNLAGYEEADIPRQTRRRSERSNVTSKVRIVNLRKPRYDSGVPLEHRKVDWQRRWMVGGHWRYQPYGPERKLRKLIWIAPYIKGPEDKPLVIRETVKVVK